MKLLKNSIDIYVRENDQFSMCLAGGEKCHYQ